MAFDLQTTRVPAWINNEIIAVKARGPSSKARNTLGKSVIQILFDDEILYHV